MNVRARPATHLLAARLPTAHLGVALHWGSWVALLVVGTVLSQILPLGDAHAYYSADLGNLYRGAALRESAFIYSPAAALASEPLRWMPFAVFAGLITLGSLAALAYLVTAPLALVLVLVMAPGVWDELLWGNIDLLVGAAIVFALRHPAWWAFMLLTKVTPGVGLLWHALRGEWRAVGIALGVAGGLVALSAVLLPGAWGEWFGVLSRSGSVADGTGMILPFMPRLALSAVLVVYAAATDRAWLVPLAIVVGLPDANLPHWTIALGSIRLLATRPAPTSRAR